MIAETGDAKDLVLPTRTLPKADAPCPKLNGSLCLLGCGPPTYFYNTSTAQHERPGCVFALFFSARVSSLAPLTISMVMPHLEAHLATDDRSSKAFVRITMAEPHVASLMFKPVPGVWVYRNPNPWMFGDAPHDFVSRGSGMMPTTTGMRLLYIEAGEHQRAPAASLVFTTFKYNPQAA